MPGDPGVIVLQSHLKDDDLGLEAVARDEPLDDKFELLLSLRIKGYIIRRKKWTERPLGDSHSWCNVE